MEEESPALVDVFLATNETIATVNNSPLRVIINTLFLKEGGLIKLQKPWSVNARSSKESKRVDHQAAVVGVGVEMARGDTGPPGATSATLGSRSNKTSAKRTKMTTQVGARTRHV